MMLRVTVICVGKLKERFFADAIDEYIKRLGAYCVFRIIELPEARLPASPSEKEIAAALSREALDIQRHLPPRSYVVAMCVEGRQKSSEELSALISQCAMDGYSGLCFLIGGSFGLAPEIKQLAALRLSMSKMTFPHHLARVMLTEQIYRAFTIAEGSKYHK